MKTQSNAVLLVTLLLFMKCLAQPKKNNAYTLIADIKGLKSKSLVHYEVDEKKAEGFKSDTIWVKNEKFTFTDTVTNYKLIYIDIPETNRSYKQKIGDKEFTISTKAHVSRIWFIAYPGAEINCTGKISTFVDAYPHDKINDDFAEINSKIFPLIDQTNTIQIDLATKNYDDIKRKELYEQSELLYDRVKKLKAEFVRSHPKSIAASYIFSDSYYRNEYTHKEAKVVFENFDKPTLSGTPFYEEVKKRLEAVESTEIGMLAPEIKTTYTLDGKEFTLSSLRGNYVLMDYWGSWCGPCMAEMPKIKEYHAKYSGKNFIVLGVNSGDPDKRWRTTIENKQFNWNHIRTTNDNNLLIPFNVSSFPTKILIDPAGKIIYSSNNKKSGTDLYQLLDSIFSKS